MKYTITINQKQAVELGLTNINQIFILDLLSTASTWAKTEIIDEDVYYWVARQVISSELPVLDLKPDTVYRHLRALAENGFIEHIKKGKKDCIRLTEKGKSYYVGNKSEKEANSEINPKKLGNKSEKNSEINPTYPNTNINPTTKDHKPPKSPNAVKDLFNETATNLPPVLKLNEKRIKAIKKLSAFDIPTLEAWRAYFCKANESNFLNGKSSDWKATFDWLLKPDNALKVAEGNYDNKVSSSDNWMDGLEDEAHG